MPHKTNQRTAEHLIRLALNRNANVPNFALLLGAGASQNSGVTTATELIERWRGQMYSSANTQTSLNEWLKDQEWFASDDEYALLFELLYDQPSQRRTFIEECVRRAHPSWGYVYLTNLLGKKVFDVVFTTNFDDLINEACYLYSDGLRPIVAAHDSSITQIRVSSSRPKIVKLHGDFLYDNIKNTLRELESLETNTKRKLMQFAQEFGLVVVGYSGRDRSVMDTIEVLLRSDEYFPHGVYWCLRKGSEVGRRLASLLRRDRVFLLEIDGFDEFMADLNSAGEFALPEAIASPLRVARDRTRVFVEIPQALRDHAVISRDVANVLREMDRSASAEEVLPLPVLAKIAESRDDIEHAIALLKKELIRDPSGTGAAVELCELFLKTNRIAEMQDSIDKLPIDATNRTYYLLRGGANERVLEMANKELAELRPKDTGLSDVILRINRAIALKRLGRQEEMRMDLDVIETAMARGVKWPSLIASGLAALRGDETETKRHVADAIRRGYLTADQVVKFPVFEDLRKDPAFEVWARSLRREDKPEAGKGGEAMKPPDTE